MLTPAQQMINPPRCSYMAAIPTQRNSKAERPQRKNELRVIATAGLWPALHGDFGRSDPGQVSVDALVDGLADPGDEAVDERLFVVRTQFLTRRQHCRNVISRSVAW